MNVFLITMDGAKKEKTNQGLRDLIECDYKETSKNEKLEQLIVVQKERIKIDNNSYEKGILKGLIMALNSLK